MLTPLWRGMRRTPVSVALGMARARTLRGENYQVAALLGDGALTGGLAYEGLNNAGISREPMVVILNDNGMSITRNVGRDLAVSWRGAAAAKIHRIQAVVPQGDGEDRRGAEILRADAQGQGADAAGACSARRSLRRWVSRISGRWTATTWRR